MILLCSLAHDASAVRNSEASVPRPATHLVTRHLRSRQRSLFFVYVEIVTNVWMAMQLSNVRERLRRMIGLLKRKIPFLEHMP